MRRPLTDREKVCIIYGYTRRMAEESKEQGLFKDFSVDEVIMLFLGDIFERRLPWPMENGLEIYPTKNG